MVIMEQDSDVIRSLPLSMLPSSTKQLLSDLLNSTKVIPTEGPNFLPRDWRGLAALANISAEVGSAIHNRPDQTGRVLEIWCRDPQATVGRLLDCLQILDRYDVYDDVCLDLTEHSTKRDLRTENRQTTSRVHTISIDDEAELITYDDRPGYIHQYDAYVLYAEEDSDFVSQMKVFLSNNGFEICTKDRLLPGHATEFAPISKLISERCRRIILVYSPEFLNSPANSFYRDYAQAVSIENRRNMTIPIMYRACTLPSHTALYHMLRYETAMYDFWEKLEQTLRIVTMPRILQNGHSMQSAHSAMNIVEMTSADHFFLTAHEDRLSANRSASVEIVRITSSPEGSITSETSQGATKKKSGLLKKMYKKVTGKKSKKAIMVQ